MTLPQSVELGINPVESNYVSVKFREFLFFIIDLCEPHSSNAMRETKKEYSKNMIVFHSIQFECVGERNKA